MKNFKRNSGFKALIGVLSLCILMAGCCLKKYPDPVIRFDHEDEDGRIYIPVDNWESYPDALFAAAPSLPPCGTNTNSSRTWVDIYNADTDARIYGFCALSGNEGLQDIWFMPASHNGRVYIIINDRKCGKNYKSNTIEYSECTDSFPNPVIAFDHKDAEGRIYIPVTNRADYSDRMFRQAPELPACGLNTSSSRTWVDIYNAATNTRIYGFCALGKKEDMKDIWFMPTTRTGMVYIIINDRSCNKNYKSNTISY
jgi:hypothetical protein